MIRLFHSLALLSLPVFGLASCTGPTKDASKAKPQTTPSPSAAVVAPVPAATGTPPAAANSPAPVADTPPKDPNTASRDAFWNLAMQRYKPPMSGLKPAEAEPSQPVTTAATPAPTISSTPSAPQPATTTAVHAQDLNPADIPYATWAPGKRGVVKSPFDPTGRLIDVRDFNAGQLSQCPYTGKIFRVPPLK